MDDSYLSYPLWVLKSLYFLSFENYIFMYCTYFSLDIFRFYLLISKKNLNIK